MKTLKKLAGKLLELLFVGAEGRNGEPCGDYLYDPYEGRLFDLRGGRVFEFNGGHLLEFHEV